MERWLDDLARALAARRSRRQTLKLLAAGLGGLSASMVRLGPARAAEPPREQAGTISYAPGWNLVGGPAGSTLVGATGNLYTLQPGDTEYEVFPATAPLQACWGYWAYFPTGGSLVPGISQAGCSVDPIPGAWTMAGNPSLVGAAQVIAADQSLTYMPASGYQPMAQIPVGAGAWVLGSRMVSIISPPVASGSPGAGQSPPEATAPTQAPASAPPPSTSTCCKHCATGIPCGNSCISARDTCHVGPGCAC